MAKYKLLRGGLHQGPGHQAPDAKNKHPKTHSPGDVIESDEPLDEMFANRFQKVEEGKEKGKTSRDEERDNEKAVKGQQELVEAGGSKEREENESRKSKGDTPTRPSDEDEDEDDEDNKVLGKDVTEEFPEAKKAKVLVLKRNRKYIVAHADAPDKALNDEPLNKSEVKDFISGVMEE